MAAAAQQFSHSGALDETQVFTPMYADDHQFDDHADYAAASASGMMLSSSNASQPRLADVDSGDSARDAAAADQALLDELEDEQLLDDDEDEEDYTAREQYERDHRKQPPKTPQDYIPTKLVGHTYGSSAPWQLHKPPSPLELLPYIRQGGNGVFEARPAAINFAGFKVGQSYTQVLSLVNVSDRVQRLHLLQPTSPSFKLSWSKKGSVAPGMAEQVQVQFIPDAYRFHEDGLRIHSIGENLLVPLQAWPTMNASNHVFPTRIRMGGTGPDASVGVGRRATKRVQLVCDIPVEFEFELQILNAHADFSVFPLRGIVPANGSTTISIDYAPKRPVTSTLQIQVNVAQFGFKPFVCTVTGVAHVLQLDAPITLPKHTQSVRQKRLASVKHLQQLKPTPLGDAAMLARPKAAGKKI